MSVIPFSSNDAKPPRGLSIISLKIIIEIPSATTSETWHITKKWSNFQRFGNSCPTLLHCICRCTRHANARVYQIHSSPTKIVYMLLAQPKSTKILEQYQMEDSDIQIRQRPFNALYKCNSYLGVLFVQQAAPKSFRFLSTLRFKKYT